MFFAGDYTIANNFGLTGNTYFNVVTGSASTLSGIISDTGVTPGVLNKSGSGTLALSGANTYTGGTAINAGTLTVADDDALGTGDVTMTGAATLGFASGTFTLANNFGLTGTPTFFVDTGNTDTISGVISDSGATPGILEKTGGGTLVLTGINTYSGGTIVNGGTLNVLADSGLGDSSGGVTLDDGTLQWGAEFSSARDIALGSGGGTFDVGSSYIINLDGVISGGGSLTKTGTGMLTLAGNNTYTGATTVSDGTLNVHGSNASSQFTVAAAGYLGFRDSTAGSATITNNGTTAFNNDSTAGSATITTTSGGDLSFADNATAGNATITTDTGGGTYIAESGSGGTARFIMNGGLLDISFSNSGTTAGSIEGDGDIYLGSRSLTVGGNDLSTEFSGVLQDGGANGGTGGSLTKEGTGNLTLSGTSAYTGATTVNGGTLFVDGSLGNSSSLTVNSGGILGGRGAVSTTVIASGGTLAPGNSIGTITVAGNLTLSSGSTYAVEVSPSAADMTIVTGTATIAGNLTTTYSGGSYTAGTQYTLLSSVGGLSGTFASVSSTNLPYGFIADVSYDPNTVFLTLTQYLDSGEGQIYASGTTTAIADERMLRNAVLDRLLAPGDGTVLWGEGFGGYNKFDDGLTIDHHHSGAIAGFDLPLDNGLRAGVAAAYTSASTSRPGPWRQRRRRCWPCARLCKLDGGARRPAWRRRARLGQQRCHAQRFLGGRDQHKQPVLPDGTDVRGCGLCLRHRGRESRTASRSRACSRLGRLLSGERRTSLELLGRRQRRLRHLYDARHPRARRRHPGRPVRGDAEPRSRLAARLRPLPPAPERDRRQHRADLRLLRNPACGGCAHREARRGHRRCAFAAPASRLRRLPLQPFPRSRRHRQTGRGNSRPVNRQNRSFAAAARGLVSPGTMEGSHERRSRTRRPCALRQCRPEPCDRPAGAFAGRRDLPCSRRHGICLPLRAVRCAARCRRRFRVVPEPLPPPAEAQNGGETPPRFRAQGKRAGPVKRDGVAVADAPIRQGLVRRRKARRRGRACAHLPPDAPAHNPCFHV